MFENLMEAEKHFEEINQMQNRMTEAEGREAMWVRGIWQDQIIQGLKG